MNRHFFKEDGQMAKKHMKKCSTSLVIMEIKVKIIVRYYFIPTRTAIIKKSDVESIGKNVDKLGPSDIVGRNVKWFSHFGNYFAQNVKIELPFSNTFFEFSQN